MDLNLAEYEREMTRWNPGGEILEREDLLLTKSPSPFPTTCVAMNLCVTSDGSAASIFERVRSFYRERKSPFSIHLRKHADEALEEICREEKMHLISAAPGMVVDRPLAEVPTPADIDIRHVTDTEGITDFASIIADSYQSLGMPAPVASQIFATPERTLLPHNDWVVAYQGRRPVSCAMALYSHGIAGLYWVGTLQQERGKGYAAACVREITNTAFRRHAQLVALQASSLGAPLYERMGFQEITRYPWYICFRP